MKNFNYKALIISTMAITVLAFALVLLHQSGLLNRDYSPYSFYDADGNPSGYDIELITMVANKLHMNLDIQMPMMNGYEATAAIRELPGTAGLPIIALSANAFEEDRNKSISYGMNDHVAKPIDIDKLLKTLAKYL